MSVKLFLPASFIVVFLLFFGMSTFAKVDPRQYGMAATIDEHFIEKSVEKEMDSLYRSSLFFKEKSPKFGMAKLRPSVNRTLDFYFLLSLVLFLGLIRFISPKYLHELWQAYLNTGVSSRSLKEKLQNSVIPNTLMNVFFSLSFGVYVFYVIRNFASAQIGAISPLVIFMLVGGVVAIYAVKYFVVRFSGWAFNMQTVTEHYLFNVFLINKILAIVLLPFIIIMAFPNPAWSLPALLISISIALFSFISRYLRSWQVLGAFFQYNKFHFFTYLCASEILPLAVLMKFLLRQLI